METIFVYSLVFLFLAGFALFSVLVLATHPDRGERRPVPGYLAAPVSPKERAIAYSVIAALLLFFLLLALQRQEHYYHSQLDLRR